MLSMWLLIATVGQVLLTLQVPLPSSSTSSDILVWCISFVSSSILHKQKKAVFKTSALHSTHLDDPGSSPCFKIQWLVTLIISAKSPLPCNVIYSQVQHGGEGIKFYLPRITHQRIFALALPKCSVAYRPSTTNSILFLPHMTKGGWRKLKLGPALSH